MKLKYWNNKRWNSVLHFRKKKKVKKKKRRMISIPKFRACTSPRFRVQSSNLVSARIHSRTKSKKISTTRIFIKSKPSSKTQFQAQSKQVSVVAQCSKNGLGIGMQSLSLWSSSNSSSSSTESLSSQSPPQPHHHTPSNQTSPVPHHTTLTLSATLPSPSKPELNPSSPSWPSMKRSNS